MRIRRELPGEYFVFDLSRETEYYPHMPTTPTKHTRQLAVELAADIRDAIGKRAKAEGRTIRHLVERMTRHYLRTVEIDSISHDLPMKNKSRKSGKIRPTDIDIP